MTDPTKPEQAANAESGFHEFSQAGSNTDDVPHDQWAAYVSRIQAAADTFR